MVETYVPPKNSFASQTPPLYFYVKLNGTKENKKQKDIKVKLSEQTQEVEDFINVDIIKKHMNTSKSYPNAILYSKNGVVLGDTDIMYMKTGDTVILARHGEAFDY